MGIIAAVLAGIAAAILLLLLLAVCAGIRRQDRAGSLASRAPGRSTGLARRVTGLYAETPPAARRPAAAGRAPEPPRTAKGARLS